MKWILLLTSNTGRVSTARSALRARAIKNGWRSGLEESLASDLHSKGVSFEYEEHRLPYKVPSRIAHYTPDFYITTKSGKVIVVESKGRFVTADRQKMLLVKRSILTLIFVRFFPTRIPKFQNNQKQHMANGVRSMASNTPKD